MKVKITVAVVIALLSITLAVPSAMAQTREAALVTAATNSLNEFMSIPNRSLPRAMLTKAQGIVIIPEMLKVGFVAGVRRGKGLAVIRDEHGSWKPPTFLTMTGGSLGFQAGIQTTDVILVFNSRKSVSGLLSGKFTIGVDAAAAAGPVGRQAEAATDGRLRAEIFSYSRSRGLFAGAAVDGSVLQVDAIANQAYYRGSGLMPDGTPYAANAQLPPTASRLLATLATYSSAPVAPSSVADVAATDGSQQVPSNTTGSLGASQGANTNLGPSTYSATGSIYGGNGVPGSAPGLPAASRLIDTRPRDTVPVAKAPTAEETRQQLAEAAKHLGALVDDSWRQYLALPKGVFTGTGTPTVESLEQSLERFDRVTKDNRYHVLLERTEFQRAISLLRTYTQQIRASSPSNNRPPVTASEYGLPARQSIR